MPPNHGRAHRAPPERGRGDPEGPAQPRPLRCPRRGRNAAGWRSRAAGTAPQPCVRHCGSAISISSHSQGSHPAHSHPGGFLRVSVSRRLSPARPRATGWLPLLPQSLPGVPSCPVSGTRGATSLQPPRAGDHPEALSGRGARIVNSWHREGTPRKRCFRAFNSGR